MSACARFAVNPVIKAFSVRRDMINTRRVAVFVRHGFRLRSERVKGDAVLGILQFLGGFETRDSIEVILKQCCCSDGKTRIIFGFDKSFSDLTVRNPVQGIIVIFFFYCIIKIWLIDGDYTFVSVLLKGNARLTLKLLWQIRQIYVKVKTKEIFFSITDSSKYLAYTHSTLKLLYVWVLRAHKETQTTVCQPWTLNHTKAASVSTLLTLSIAHRKKTIIWI